MNVRKLNRKTGKTLLTGMLTGMMLVSSITGEVLLTEAAEVVWLPSQEVRVGKDAGLDTVIYWTGDADEYVTATWNNSYVDVQFDWASGTGNSVPVHLTGIQEGTDTIQITLCSNGQYGTEVLGNTALTVHVMDLGNHVFNMGPSIWNLTYDWSNSHSGFQYADDYSIPYEAYERMYGQTSYAELLSEKIGTWGGSCYGMATTIGLMTHRMSDAKLSDFKMDALNPQELSLSDISTATSLNVKEFIETMHVSQYSDYLLNVERHCFGPEKVYQALCKEKNYPLEISIFGVDRYFGETCGHALLGYMLQNISDTEARLYVYDCNYPAEENHYVSLWRAAADAPFSSWEYYDEHVIYNSDMPECDIAATPYEDYAWAWANRGNLSAMGQGMSNNNVLFANSENLEIYRMTDAGEELVAVMNDGILNTNNDAIFKIPTLAAAKGTGGATMISLPVDYYLIRNVDGTTQEFEVAMVDRELGADVTTNAGEVVFQVEDQSNTNTAALFADENTRYDITLLTSKNTSFGDSEYKGAGGTAGVFGNSEPVAKFNTSGTGRGQLVGLQMNPMTGEAEAIQ